MPTLYVVATPIGNLEDMTLRAVRILKEVKLIAAEDTRKTRKLLNSYDIRTPMTSYYEHNKLAKLDSILNTLETGDVALVSDAGTPGISDPGYELVVAAAERNIPVVAVPGASSVVSALSISGLPTDRFTFLGFLPRKTGAKTKLLQSMKAEPGTLIILESPRRLNTTLADLLEYLGDRRIAVCRELTKLHEEVFRGTVSEAIRYFTEPRGEFTLVIEGRTEAGEPEVTENIEQVLAGLRESGMRAREAIAEVSGRTGLSRKELYQTWLKLG
ncbi:MAG: 16S rRNA (cytidine(1402)-2'-O)-methyltransferase [Dehalococcoidales bacterium]|nr:16S rRNA (cytidine(1402)-2'-O)-methyltransferase [Dehalococcoidales bacterium]